VLYAVADHVVDDYVPVIDGIDNDLLEVEAEVFNPQIRNPAERIFKLKREVLDFNRNAEPLLDALEILETGDLPHVPDELDEYFRDVHDHLLRVDNRIDAIGALLTDALNANLAHVAVRQNDDMRTISAWVAIAAIPTMIGGVYGMNFTFMPELDHPAGYPVVMAIILVLCFAAYRHFKRVGWL
jgi:magnesium transporter